MFNYHKFYKPIFFLIELINIKQFFIIGYTGLSFYFFYHLTIYSKFFITILLLAFFKLLYKLSQLSLLDIICFKSNLDLDCDIIYLLYKNRNNKEKINVLLKNTEEDTKDILSNSIYSLIFKKNYY